MNLLHSFLLVLFLQLHVLSAQVMTYASPESVGMSTERIENLTTVLQNYVDSDQLAGAVALVVRKNKIVYFEAVGQRDKANNRPMQTDAIFRIASQTKALVSVGIMI
ncbi:MAG: serine hydrolase, partial [Bacteroidetes bacterium]|nr:serine hydrolase [Bacteroidota bacterium]